MPWVRIFSVFFPSFLRSSSVCAVAAAAEKNRTAAADAKNFMRSPWAKIRADHVSSSSASARPEAVMLHLQRPAVNSPGRALYLEAGVGLESRFVEEDVMHEMKRRDFIRGATLGALAFTVGGGPILLTAREARAQSVPFRLLKASEADTLEALGETLVPGARAAGISHFIDQQLSVPPEEALLEARILNVKPPYANFYRAAIGAVDKASQTLNSGRRFAQLNPSEQHDFVDTMRQNK